MKHPQLYDYFRQMAPIPQDEWLHLEDHLELTTFKKGDFLAEQGGESHRIAFILTGCFRHFYLTSCGKEYNDNFLFEGDFCSSLYSFVNKIPSLVSIQALEDTQALILCHNFLREEVYSWGKHWETIGRLQIERYYSHKFFLEYSLKSFNALERYQKLILERGPRIAQRIPQYHQASYIGVTASAFNRILKSQKEVSVAGQ